MVGGTPVGNHCSMPLLSMTHNKYIAIKTFMKVIVNYLKTHKVSIRLLLL